jgi:myosin protein heavy chain
MARPSGLASDHHPEGPGDAPRRRKSTKGTPSVEFSQGSKRAASPSHDPVSPAPKRKRVQSDDHDQLARELEESVSRAQSQTSDGFASARKSILRHTRRNSEPVVAYPDIDEEDYDENEDDTQLTPSASTQPLPGLTPHLRRIGASRGRPTNAARRARMSMPAQFHIESVDEMRGNQIQFVPFTATIDGRTRRRLKRNHYSDEWNDLEGHKKEDKKLRKSYIELKRQLDDKNKQIADLEYQIEARRLGEINLTDDETDDLRDQLSQAKEQIAELRASSAYRGDSRETSAFDGNADFDFDDDDDEPLLAIDPADPDGPEPEEIEPLDNGPYASLVLSLSSQVTADTLRTLPQTSQDSLVQVVTAADKVSDKTIKRYEAEITRLIELVAEAQGALRLMTIDLQNTDILGPGATADAIIAELRHAFEDVREEMENLIPGCTEGLNNGQFLRKLPSLFEGLLSELQDKTILAEKFHQESRVLRAQFENSMGLLERSETRNDNLEGKLNDLQRDNEDLRANIFELEERVTTLDALANQQDADMQQKDVENHGLKDQISDKEVALTRLRDSLEQYRTDLENATETAIRTEEQLQQTIADLEQNHAAEVLELQTQLQDENEARLQAQGEAEQKSEYIEELQDKVKAIEDEVDGLMQDLEELRNRLATELEGHDQTKELLQEEQDRVYAQQNQIENLEEKLEQLQTELADTNKNLDAEREQREKTEALLDEANNQIEDLQERIRTTGMEAQGLRSKLFEAQMEREEIVKKLETAAHDREVELQNALDTETAGREVAEQTVADLEERIAGLEEDIASRVEDIARLNQELADTEKDRDEHIATLNTQIADLQQQYAALENTSNSTITSLQANITDLNNEVNELRIDIDRITNDAAEREADLKEELARKEQELADREQELADKEQEIAEKNRQYAELQNKYTELDDEHCSAIERFSNEQFSFNKLQEKFIRGQKTMEDKIKAMDAQIRDLQAQLAQLIRDHEAAILEKEDEIRDLQITTDHRTEIIAELNGTIEALKDSHAQIEEDTRNTIENLNAAHRVLLQQNEDMTAELLKRNSDAVQAAYAVKAKGLVVKAKNTDLKKVANGKITKTSERVKVGKKGRKPLIKERKWRDSGFGADSDIENEEVEEEGEALMA